MNVEDIEQSLNKEFRGFEFGRRRFPALFQSGLSEPAVHSGGVSYLLGLGIDLGLSAIAEYPITVHASSPWKSVGRVFPDSVWFHPQTRRPWIAFEFERFERNDEGKIRDKVENLVLSYHQTAGDIELCVFLYWLRSSLAPKSVTPLFEAFKKGYRRQGLTIPPVLCRFLIFKCVVCQAESSLGTTGTARLGETRPEYRIVSEDQQLAVSDIRRMDG